MSEARARHTSHFKSSIFTEGPAPTSRRLRSVNSKAYESSQIFTPAEVKSKPFSYSREKYFENSGFFKEMDPVVAEPEPLPTDNTTKPVAGYKEKYVPPYNILGNDRPQFYRKSQNKHLAVSAFQPKFEENSVRKRVEKEFHGGFHPIHTIVEEKPAKPELNAQQRKLHNLKSVFDKNANKENTPGPCENKKVDYSSAKRKFEMLASGVFNEKPVQEFPRVSRKEEFDEKRHKHHLYSDLSGNDPVFLPSRSSNLFSVSESWLEHPSKPNNVL
jgi:hypothetical protein